MVKLFVWGLSSSLESEGMSTDVPRKVESASAAATSRLVYLAAGSIIFGRPLWSVRLS